ncbi:MULTISPECIES: GNAT family N-acetyltransferase [unclassified Lysinibacillus]|uniref:GNAT family N-acetyltransferase n=1 Tax=unclassified Lysinibacillus TaxID=2636778 RepID=UPI0020139925|nr:MULTISPECIES: GNAT family N-acetyltransferase [unclassified Lysinibacillus]MCL1696565.1 GNAT family N-acetyltransferase [Lysinibacillus sp. BPa_S21]MCL1698953.1 GNAT family N-acetyltransferase [Lysinibacillus sp. Bpr_S20]
MLNIEHIMQLDINYIKSFSRMETWHEGVLFYNQEMPTYYDANHAHIWKKIAEPDMFLQEIKNFYQSKSLIPRLYLYNLEDNQSCIEALEIHGFRYESFTDDVQLWNGEHSQLPHNPAIQIERVTDANMEDALAVEMSISTFGEPALIKKAFEETYHSPHFTYYLLRLDGEVCCTANIFVSGNQGRVESVATIESHRGRGLIGYILQHIQQESVKQGLKFLWILPINEQVAKVYDKANFKSVGTIESIHAFTEGKSINQIRQGS